MTLRTFGKVVFVAALVLPAAVSARQTFKKTELPKVDFQTEKAPKLSITTESGQSLPVRLQFESKIKSVDARAQVLKITYTRTGLAVELTGGAFTERNSGWGANEHSFQKLELEFSFNGELVNLKSTR